MRALSVTPPPSGLTPKQVTTYRAGMKHVAELANQTDAVVATLDAALDSSTDIPKNKLDSLSEMGEMESLRLQMAMDRLSKLFSTLSNLLKRISDTAAAISQNLK